MSEFLDRVAEVLEVPAVGAGDEFREAPMWGSLMAFGLVVMIGQRYGRKVTVAGLSAARTVADLAALAGVEP